MSRDIILHQFINLGNLMNDTNPSAFSRFLHKNYNYFLAITALIGGLFLIPQTIDFFYPIEDYEVRAGYEKPQTLIDNLSSLPITVQWNNSKIENLYYVNFYIWNNGKNYIDDQSITESYPLYISFSENINILRITKEILPRNSLGITLDEPKDQKIYMRFNKKDDLGHHEGLKIALYYTGSINPKIELKGFIKGSTEEPKTLRLNSIRSFDTFFKILPFLFVIMIFLSKSELKKSYYEFIRKENYLNGIFYLLILLLSVLMILTLANDYIEFSRNIPEWLKQISIPVLITD